jgi:hypothetical protein
MHLLIAREKKFDLMLTFEKLFTFSRNQKTLGSVSLVNKFDHGIILA